MIHCLDDVANGTPLHVNIWFGIPIDEFVIAELYAQVRDQKWHINCATNQSCQNIKNNSKERL
jgi:hypothetical protein